MIVWAPGTTLGPYELIAPLGAGGMGEVWKARDTQVDRVVAIKRLKAEHTERFKREARAIAALNHPRICQLYDIGSDHLVMEYVEGPALTVPCPWVYVDKLHQMAVGKHRDTRSRLTAISTLLCRGEPPHARGLACGLDDEPPNANWLAI